MVPCSFIQSAIVLLCEKSIHSFLLCVFDLFEQRDLTLLVLNGALRLRNLLLRPTRIVLIVALIVLHVVATHFSIFFDQFVLEVFKQLGVAHFKGGYRSTVLG